MRPSLKKGEGRRGWEGGEEGEKRKKNRRKRRRKEKEHWREKTDCINPGLPLGVRERDLDEGLLKIREGKSLLPRASSALIDCVDV